LEFWENEQRRRERGRKTRREKTRASVKKYGEEESGEERRDEGGRGRLWWQPSQATHRQTDTKRKGKRKKKGENMTSFAISTIFSYACFFFSYYSTHLKSHILAATLRRE